MAAGADRDRTRRPIVTSTSPTISRWRSSRCSSGSRPKSAPPSCCTTCSTSATARSRRCIEKSEAACRQVVHRARERVRGDRKRFDVTESAKAALLQRFIAAMEARDEQALLALFAPDATWTADGGGKTAAAPRPIVGADRIARLRDRPAREVLGRRTAR